MSGGKKVRKIKFCEHCFHENCLYDWIREKESCPNCKLELGVDNLEKLEKKERKKEEERQLKKLKLKDQTPKKLVLGYKVSPRKKRRSERKAKNKNLSIF